MSLDEWALALTDCIKDWENVEKYDKENLKTDREWLEGYGINGKNANEFIYNLLKQNVASDLKKLLRPDAKALVEEICKNNEHLESN